MTIYTIGHGRRTWTEFVSIIETYAIDLVVDVRYRAQSRWVPWANRKRLEVALGDRYLYDGARLGNPAHFGAPPIPEADRRAAIADLERLVRAGERVAIMCSETKPADCHRVDIAADLAAQGVEALHL